MILLVAIVCAAPFVSAWIAYYFFKPDGGGSYGTLLETRSVIARDKYDQLIEGKLKGKWLLLHTERGDCGAACSHSLYATRQAWTMLGRERDRVVRVAVIPGEISKDDLIKHEWLVVSRSTLPIAMDSKLLYDKIVLIDPLGNQVIAWDRSQDLKGIKRLNGDLQRLMRATKWSTEPQSR
jgi:hypothetical protein